MAITRTPIIFNASVIVDATHGDKLVYKVTVRGATPGRFTLIDAVTKQLIWSSNSPPISTTPDFVYEREWPMPADPVNAQTSHTMGFQFLGIRDVKYEVALHHLLGGPEPILDIEYHATSDADSIFEDLLVTTF
jgi:hypothetical protein